MWKESGRKGNNAQKNYSVSNYIIEAGDSSNSELNNCMGEFIFRECHTLS